MEKILFKTIFFVFILLLSACQQEEAEPTPEQPPEEAIQTVESPEGRVAEFIELWNISDFPAMQTQYLNQGTQTVYGEANFVTWQQELHKQLGMENMNVTYTKPDKDTQWDQEQPADFKINVNFDSIVGPVEFNKTLTLLYDQDDWFVEWDPSFILPNLEAGDHVTTNLIEGARGEILDRNGKAIASNSEGYEIGVVPENFDLSKKQQLAQLLGISEETIDGRLNQPWVQPHYLVPIAQIKADQATLDELFTIRGTTQEKVTMRNYPYNLSLSHVTGYVGPITAQQLASWSDQGYTTETLVGRQGLEEVLQERLRGKAGGRIILKKQRENAVITSVENEPVPGETVTLTIDAELQKKIYTAMKEQPGASAAIDPATGETLALVSSPGFDPNEFVPNITNSRFQELANDPLQPFFNRFAAVYTPGPVIQPITAAIGMESGTLDPAEGLDITGKTWQRYRSWGDFRITRPREDIKNPIDLDKALVYSDSIYFARQALNIQDDDFQIGLEKFGFDEETDFPMELKASRISKDGTFGSEGQLADTASGQGQMQVNILHLANLYSPILTDGKLYKPTLFVSDEKPQLWNENVLNATNAEILQKSLSNSGVQLGTKIAGKSGTANERGKQTKWFVGYQPANPKLIIAMMIQGNDQVEKMVEEALDSEE